MLSQMFIFEWRYFTRQPSFYISALIILVLSFLAASMDQIDMGGGNILKNGPFMIGQMMSIMGIFSMFLVVNFIGSAAMRDHGSAMEEILYTKPIKPAAYQLGRFLGAFAVIVCVYSAVPVGLIIGSLMPWVSETKTGPFDPGYYLTTFFYLSVPTLFIFACLFYALAIRVKSMMAIYLAVIGVVVLNEISEAFLLSPVSRSWAALLDPFAVQTFAEITRYWTIFEKNSQQLVLSGVLLENRAIWILISLVIMAVFGGFFRSLKLVQTKAHKKVSSKKT
jgi:ABC-2 type transport system permease protein